MKLEFYSETEPYHMLGWNKLGDYYDWVGYREYEGNDKAYYDDITHMEIGFDLTPNHKHFWI